MVRRPAPALAFALCILSSAACREAPLGFGPTPATARQNADDFLSAYAQRFTNITRSPKTAYIRLHLGSGALLPSRVFADTGIWTASIGDSVRVAAYNSWFSAGRYTFDVRNPPDRLERVGDSYHSTRLRRLSRDEYEWTTSADFAVGRMPTNALPAVISRALRAAEEKGAAGVRADYRASFARTTAALGRLYTLDSLRVTPDTDGASTIVLSLSADPDRLRRTHPSLADYLRKYIDRTTARAVVTDRRGAPWLEASVRDKRLNLRLRSRNGQFAPLEGPVRPLPDSLILRTDFKTRIRLFEVGWKNLVTDMTLTRTGSDQAWQLRSTREPEWELPPLTRQFISTPLRRPFAGPGVNFRIGFRTLPSGQTSLYRRGLMQVQESAILRFLGRLSGQAMGEFYGRSEADENSFNGDAFAALRADIADILSGQQ